MNVMQELPSIYYYEDNFGIIRFATIMRHNYCLGKNLYIYLLCRGTIYFTREPNNTHYLLDRTNQMKPSDKKWCEDISMENG